MMFGNVAPAPLSCTCAAAGAAAPSRAARARKRVDVMSVVFSEYALERELRLQQDLVGGRGTALEREAIEVREEAHVGGQLIRRARDDARVLVVADVLVGVDDVHARDHGRLAAREVIDAEGADDAAGDRRGLRGD